jgi:hypothetical protein
MNNLEIMKLVIYTSYLLSFYLFLVLQIIQFKLWWLHKMMMMINLAYIQEIGLILLCHIFFVH